MVGTPAFSENFSLIPPGSSCAILVRHAERPQFRVRRLGNNVPITAGGASASVKFGAEPGIRSITGAYSSPVLRCVQTADKILEGARLNHVKVTTRSTLGEPGSYIKNRWAAGRHFLLRDAPGVIEEYIARGKLDGFLPLKEGSTALLSSILHDLSDKNSRNLYVSHDAVIAPFIYYYTGEKFGRDHWLNFLDGVIITAQGDDVRLIRNGKEHAIRKNLFI